MKHKFTFFIYILISICAFSFQLAYPQNFLTVNGTKIVDQSGQEIHFRGMGLGGWLEPEGYMFGMSNFANSPSQIQKKIQDLIGTDNTNSFYSAFRNNFVTESDIKALSSWGFNLVRVPFHYNILTPPDSPGVYLQSGWAIFDSLISWCTKYNVYVILDLHCAPGGESDQTISDYDPAVPSLWQDTAKQTRTVELWRTIANRYKDNPTVAGYDLLNEPRWDFPNGNNKPLHDLYVRITNAIRSVDANHILFIEGNQYATDFSGLTPPWDSKIVYSFHKYWNTNTSSSIQGYLNLRSSTNAPLWLGETGENSNSWFTECVTLMNQNDIGWSWWTLKKFNTINAAMNVPITSDYQQLVNYWGGTGAKPSVTFATNALLRMADNLKFENCVFQNDMIDALMRQPNDNSTLPYASNDIPGVVYFDNYDLGKITDAYNDVDYENSGGNQTSWNSGNSYRNDGVDIEQCNDLPTNGYDVGWINAGEWLKYTVNIQKAGAYNVDLRYASNQSGGKLIMNLDGNLISPYPYISIPVTGGWQTWQTLTLQNIQLPAGTHTLQVQFLAGGFNLNYLSFPEITKVSDSQAKVFTFSLAQNYPNPFNPSTVIKYSVPAKSLVNLKIYNMLGKEIATLVNGIKTPGDYSVSFNASELPSGIYFYRIIAGKNTEVKKMILLK
ncbi:MAG TPA: cellulase family glycosylhydrolase [Ignavibacteriaceae bacterium]|nr:cellulase family glycosylhydrolase [Ignavibacteriaceae bacterium]